MHGSGFLGVPNRDFKPKHPAPSTGTLLLQIGTLTSLDFHRAVQKPVHKAAHYLCRG
jgi:hypothetical protein